MKTLLLGDMSPTVVTTPLFDKKDVEALFTDVVTLFQGNDVNFVNLECALTESEKSIEKFGPPLKAALNTAEVLKSIGVNCCGLSNNHIFDYGIRGAKDTIQALEQEALLTRDLVMIMRIPERIWCMILMERNWRSSRYVSMSILMHWKIVWEAARMMSMIQWKTWNSSLAVKYDSTANTIEFVPLVNSGRGIAIAKGEQKEEILKEFEKRNRELAEGKWKEGWHAFCESMRDWYMSVIGNACTEKSEERQNKNFGHYLDCEAHTDVWRELFPTANQTNEK